MPLFQDDPLSTPQDATGRAPLGQPTADPFAPQPDFRDTLGAAFRQNNPIFSVIEAVNAQSPDTRRDPSYNPMDAIKGTPFEQDPGRFVDDPNRSVTEARMAQARNEDSDRTTLAQSGTSGVVAALGAGLLDPSFYLPIVGEAHTAEAGASFVQTAGRMAAIGAGQSSISEAALAASQQSRGWKEAPGGIATNTLLMGILGGAFGRLSAAERVEANEALESVRRDSTSVNPIDPSSMSLQQHITPGESGLSQGVEQRAAELHAAGIGTPAEAAEAAHVESLPPEIASEVYGPTAQDGIAALAERGDADRQYDPTGALGEPGSGRGAVGGYGFEPDPALGPTGGYSAAGGSPALDPGAIGERLDTAAQDALAMPRPQAPGAEPALPPDANLTLRNARTGEAVNAQTVTTLGDALKQSDVSENVGVDQLSRASSLAMGDRLTRLIGDMPVYTVGADEMARLAEGRLRMQPGYEPAGFYDPQSGHIVALDDAMRDPAEASRLMLHEGLHGAFSRTINESAAAREVIDHLRSTAAESHIANGGAAADHYGLTNPHEFVSEAFSNPEFQRFLASVPADDRVVQALGLDRNAGRSVWDVFVGAVRKILGMAPGQHSLLEAAMRVGELLEARRGELGPAADSGPLRPSERATEGGAAVSDTRDLRLKGFGLDKVPGVSKANAKLSPNLRVYSGESVEAKRAMAGLANTSLRFTQHDRGLPTTEGGTLESAVAVDKARYQVAGHEALQSAYIEHRYGGQKPGVARRAADTLADVRGQTPAGKLSYKDFKSAVYDAMYSGDQHPIPEVQKAAQELRQTVFDPVKKMLQETLGPDGRPMLGEELSAPGGDKSFVPRAWNHEAVIAKRFQLKQTITDWLGGEQAKKAAGKERIEGFVNDLKSSGERLAAMSEDDPARVHEQATHDGIRAKIEKEIGDWQGSSSAEAKSALSARASASPRRQTKMDEGTYRGAGERLTSADDAVDRASRRILGSDQNLSRLELADRADEVIDRVIGSPDGRIPYDAASGGPKIGFTGGPAQEVRGSLKARDFAIPTGLVKDFVHTDMEHVVSSYLRTMLPDLQLTRRFGDVDMTNTFRRIQEEYARKIDASTSETQSRAIHAQRDSDIRDVAATRDRLRGVYGWNPDPASRKLASIVRDFHAATSLASLGTSVANRLNDIGAQAVMRYGIQNVFNEAWRPFFKSMIGMSPLAGIAKQQAKEMGVGIDGLLGHLRHNLSDINDNYLPGNKFSRGLAWANDRSMLINLHGPWTDWMKAMAWVPAQAELGRLADRVAAGTHSAKDLSRLADANISPEVASRISEQLKAHSITVDGVRMADAGKWTDLGARDAFERAMSREANINVITAGIGQKPLFLSKPIGGLVGQFKSFVAGAHENILLSNLQQRDGRTMQGALVAMTMGMLSYRLYTLLAGQDASPRPQDWIKEGLARSALTGWFNEANNTLAKFTAGKVDYSRLYGADRPLTRRTENSPLSELLGPTYSQLEGVTGIGVHALGGHFSAADIHAARHMMPLQNLMGARIGFDSMEDGLANVLGVKPRNHSPQEWPQ